MTEAMDALRSIADIPKLPSKWEMLQLKDIATLITKGTTPTTYHHPYVDDGIPFLRAEDIESGEVQLSRASRKIDFETHELLRRSKLQAGDVLITIAGAIGRSALVPDTADAANINQAVALVRLRKDVALPEFISCQIESNFVQSQLGAMQRGVAQKNLNLRQIGDLYVALPPIETQRAIVSTLHRANRLRNLRKQANQLTRKIIQSVFLKMFGDPASNPRGWPSASFDDIIREGPQNGFYKHSSFYGSGAPIVRINNFYDGVLFASNLKRVRATEDEIRTYKLDAGDILINRVNSPEFVGKCALVENLPEDTVFESNMMRFKLDTDRAIQQFIIMFLLTDYAKAQILSKSKRAVHQVSINQQDVKAIQLYLPPLDLQKRYAQIVKRIHSLTDKQSASTEEITELFHSLMHKAFRGELAVAKASEVS